MKKREDYSEEIENQYKRMRRSYDRIMIDFRTTSFSKSGQERLDNVYDFFLICYHLREWIKKDKKTEQCIKDILPTFEGNDAPVQLQICRDLCNRSKHAILEEKYKPNDPNTNIVLSGGGVFRVSTKEITSSQQRKETVHLKEEDSIFLGNYFVFFQGNLYDLKGVVEACLYIWNDFFGKSNLLLPRSTPY